MFDGQIIYNIYQPLRTAAAQNPDKHCYSQTATSDVTSEVSPHTDNDRTTEPTSCVTIKGQHNLLYEEVKQEDETNGGLMPHRVRSSHDELSAADICKPVCDVETGMKQCDGGITCPSRAPAEQLCSLQQHSNYTHQHLPQ